MRLGAGRARWLGVNCTCSGSRPATPGSPRRYTGQEEIYRKTFAEFNVSEHQFGNWSNGAAWLAWSRGQSMHGVGTSDSQPGDLRLSRAWMQQQWALQRQILARMRALGIVSVLPAFQGNVPQVMAAKCVFFCRLFVSIPTPACSAAARLLQHCSSRERPLRSMVTHSPHSGASWLRQLPRSQH